MLIASIFLALKHTNDTEMLFEGYEKHNSSSPWQVAWPNKKTTQLSFLPISTG